MKFRTTAMALAAATLALQSAWAGEAEAKKWIDSEFQPSSLNKEQQAAEMKWFIDAAKKLQDKGVKDVNGWGRDPDPATCPAQSLLIVITGGDARLNGSSSMTANLVLTSEAPYGHVFKANGTARLIGTIYADTLDLTGNVDVSLDACFLQNLSPSLVDTTFSVTSYREIDRTG